MPPTISATDRPLEKLTADAVVVGVGKGPDGPLATPGAEAVDRLLGGRLMAALADLGARGAEDEVTRLATFGQGPFPVVAVAGLGAPRADGTYAGEAVRRAAGAASRALVGRASVDQEQADERGDHHVLAQHDGIDEVRRVAAVPVEGGGGRRCCMSPRLGGGGGTRCSSDSNAA